MILQFKSGDAFKFTDKLATLCAERGVEFFYNTDIKSLNTEKGRAGQINDMDMRQRHEQTPFQMRSDIRNSTSILDGFERKGPAFSLPSTYGLSAAQVSS